MATHPAVCMVGIRKPLEVLEVPTVAPLDNEVLVQVNWTCSTPLDLHQADGGLLVKHPQVMGDGIAGIVVEIGPKVTKLAVNDEVFGFGWREQKEKAHQKFTTMPQDLLGKLPKGFTPQEAVTLPNNFVTIFHTVVTDLAIPLPWPKPSNYHAPSAEKPILIWGGSSSVGQYALQILRYYGYKNLFTTASKTHHDFLKSLGATYTFDYRDADVSQAILKAATACQSNQSVEPVVPSILDCIGSKNASMAPIANIAQNGSKVAVLLPIIVKDASDTEAPEYAMDVSASADWAKGVDSKGVRTHFYLDNDFHREYLQPVIMPTMLAKGIVKPNKQRIVEGDSLVKRAETALSLLRRKEVSGERLVWRIS